MPPILRSTNLARWGLFTTVLLTVVALVGTAVAGYYTAVDASDSVVRARTIDLLFAARRALLQARGPLAETAREIHEEMSDQGLTYLGVYTRSRHLLAEAGKPAAPELTRPITVPNRWPPVVTAVGDGTRYRVITRLAGQGPARRWRRGEQFDTHSGAAPSLLVLEFEPQITASIVGRARQTVAVAIVAAVLLVGAAFVFWWMSLRHEILSTQLSKDRQLRLLGEMSAVLGHELRNPLAALKGHAQLLVERLPDGSTRQGAATIVRESMRLEELAEHVLAFARTGTVDRTPEDPAAVARAAVSALADERLRLEAGPDLPRWSLDRVRMEQALVNVIRNALQASPPGASVEVKVSCEADLLRFDVCDHGDGIPEGDQTRIFEPFHTTRARGTGLGLTVARRVVEGHGGRILASNRPDGGALFRVEIPRDSQEVT